MQGNVVMRKYLIMGVQGSGKGTQAGLLCRDFELVHISVGDLFRWHAQNHTRLGGRVRRLMAAGRLVPDHLVEELVRTRLDLHDWNYGFVLDGFPRNRHQVEFFLESYDVDAVIVINVPDAVVMDRILNRRLCERCGRDYNLLHHRPAREGVCDGCGGRLAARADDTAEAVRARLQDYHLQTEPVLELFRRKEFVAAVDGTKSPADIQEDIRRQLGLAPECPALNAAGAVPRQRRSLAGRREALTPAV
jgi:adenylate kinase